MKRWCIVFVAVLLVAICSACGRSDPKLPHTWVLEGDDGRFFVVDEWEEECLGDLTCYVIADKYTGVMYMIIENGVGGISMTPMYCEDGSLIIYDGI